MFCDPGPPSSELVPPCSSSSSGVASGWSAPSRPRSSSSEMTSLITDTVSHVGTLDTFGRPLRDLRISVTDRCNFRCTYCMPKEVYGRDFQFLERSQLLSFDEIHRLVRIFRGHGVEKVRITGGEPLVRRDLPDLIAMLAALRTPDDGDIDLTLTTNGSALRGLAGPL